MDKSWVGSSNRNTTEYISGIERFLDFAYANKALDSEICCPCKKCRNRYFKSRHDVFTHCILDGFHESYTNWIYHGESSRQTNSIQNDNCVVAIEARDEVVEMVREAIGIESDNLYDDYQGQESMTEDPEGANEATKTFFKLLKDAECELYPGCAEFTKLSFVICLLLLKVTNGWQIILSPCFLSF